MAKFIRTTVAATVLISITIFGQLRRVPPIGARSLPDTIL